ncbi:serine/threonine-protein kinase [Nocardioides sp. J54]|uniref:serine/threonine-protein kinase n=1 Tax=Nocardioides sp. J54 TaxID=935866 RepID=UPI0004B1FFDC|nr:serine/threonine-protein kinase [Nocardioides sp. J54]
MARFLGVGDTIGPYRITWQLGAGGMGVVYEAVEEGLGRRVALKVLAVQLAEEPEFRQRFLREATVLARSDSPHIIQVYSHGEQDGVLYLATQFVSGGDLAARIAREGVPSVDTALDLAAQVASALADAHAVGVVHRDVKPHNVLLRAGQDQVHAYLCDFGIARDDESALTHSGVVAGTYAYLAPERFRGEPATPASDVYALGCLLWFLLTGRPPYDGGPVQLATQHELAPVPQLPGAPAQLNAFLARAMAKDPAARHPSAAAAAAHLRAVRAAGGFPADGGGPAYRPAPSTFEVPQVASYPSPLPAPTPVQPDWPPRRGLLVVTLVALAVLVGVGGGLAWSLLRDGDPGEPTASGSTASDSPGTGESGSRAAGPVAVADVDGDGLDDTVLLDDGADETVVLLSDDRTSSGFGQQQTWAGTAWGDALVVRGDYTGDGRADVAAVRPSRVRVAASTGGSFDPATRWARLALPEEFKVVSGDFDADGRDDLALARDVDDGVRVDVALSDGERFAKPVRWARVPGVRVAEVRLGAGDADGDGNVDLVGVVPADGGGIEVGVLRSEGDRFAADEEWFRADWSLRDTRPVVGDVDGDGDADVVALRAVDGGIEVVTLLAADGGLAESGRPQVVDLRLDRTRSVGADTDGDGRMDLVLVDRDTAEARRLVRRGKAFTEDGRVEVDAEVDERGSILVAAGR